MRLLKDSERMVNVGVAPLLGVIVWLLYFTSHPVTESLDWENYYKANFHFLFQSLKQGEFPWWNPCVGLGRPFVSDLQNAIWYPGTYLLLLGETAGLFLAIWAHTLIASIGTQRLAMELGAAFRWAVPAGVVFALSGPVGIRHFPGQFFFVFGISYLPWILLLVLRLPNSSDLRLALWLALLQSLQFLTGHPQATWITMVGTGGYTVLACAHAWFRRSAAKPWLPLAQYLGALALGGLITAIAWLPMLDLIEQGNRASPDLAYSSFGRLEWTHVLGWFTRPPMEFPPSWEMNPFVGFAWSVPFLVGVFLIRDVRLRILLVVGLVLFCFAFGDQSLVFRGFYWLVPGTSSFRLPGRILVWPVLIAVLVSAVVLSRAPAERNPRYLVASIGAAGLGCLFLNYPQRFHDGTVIGLIPPIFALAAALGLLCLIWEANRKGLRLMPYTVLLVALTVFEFWPIMRHYRRAYAVGTHMGVRTNQEEVARVKSLVAQLQAGKTEPVRANFPSWVIPANHAMIHRYSSVDAYTSLFLKRPWEALHEVTATPAPAYRNSGFTEAFFENHPFAVPGVSIDLGVLPGTMNLVTNASPLPRAWFNTPDQPAKIVRFADSEITVQVKAPIRGYLVLNEAWYPGWTASFGEKVVATEPFMKWMRGAQIPAGEHEVVFRFRPRGWWAAALISVVGIALLALGLSGRRPGCFRVFAKPPESSRPGSSGRSDPTME